MTGVHLISPQKQTSPRCPERMAGVCGVLINFFMGSNVNKNSLLGLIVGKIEDYS